MGLAPVMLRETSTANTEDITAMTLSILPRGTHFMRAVQAELAHPENPVKWAERHFGADSLAVRLLNDRITRSAQDGFNSAEDAALVPDPQGMEFIERVY